MIQISIQILFHSLNANTTLLTDLILFGFACIYVINNLFQLVKAHSFGWLSEIKLLCFCYVLLIQTLRGFHWAKSRRSLMWSAIWLTLRINIIRPLFQSRVFTRTDLIVISHNSRAYKLFSSISFTVLSHQS